MQTISRPLTLITAPLEQPCSIAELKMHCNVVGTSRETELTLYAKACRITLEKAMGIVFVDSTYEEKFDYFPQIIKPYRTPLISITEFAYYNTSGQETALVVNTDYQLDLAGARVAPAPNAVWPTTQAGRLAPIRLRYKAGWASAAAVPEDLKNLLMMFTAMAFDGRLPVHEVTGEVPVPVGIRQIMANRATWGF